MRFRHLGVETDDIFDSIPETKQNAMRNFREMKIWNQGIDLAVLAYEITKQFPKEELYGLKSKITRAVV